MAVNCDLANVFEKAKSAFENKLPFVVYRQPESNLVKSIFQKNNTLFFINDYQESGFVFAPFDNEEPSILFPLSESILYNSEFDIYALKENRGICKSKSNIKDSKAEHLSLVKKGINFLENNDFKKVVLSRKETLQLANFKVFETFKKLLANYKNAFVYCWFHPKVGLWLGATPETLLKVDKNYFSTMALAATQVDAGKAVRWSAKEEQEQQIVTDFILDQLGIDAKVSKPYTIKAGNLLHLRTDISGKVTKNVTLKHIIRLLHPTPAVCGVPNKEAKDFILHNESYNRQFYTGFLGELNLNGTSSLFVNLRCMQVLKNDVAIYIGGGITKGSNPEEEWEETVAKSKVILNILH